MSQLVRKTALARLRAEAGKGLVVIVLGVGMSAVASVTLAKLLPAEQFGVYVFAMALLNYGVILARGGMNTAAIRYVNEYLSQGKIHLVGEFVEWARHTLIVLGLVATGLGALVAVGTSLARPALELRNMVPAVAGLAPLSFAYLHTALLRAEKKIVLSQLPLTVFRPLFALLTALLAVWWGATQGVVVAYGEIIGLALMVVPLSRLTRHLRQPTSVGVGNKQKAEWTRTTKRMTFSALSQQLIGQADILAVGFAFGMVEAGLYGLASRLAKLIVIGNKAAETIAAPMIAEAYHGGEPRTLQALVGQTCTLVVMASLVMTVGAVLIPETVYAWLGEEYANVRQIFLILVVGQVINSVTGPVSVILLMTGNENIQTLVNVLAGVVLIGGIMVLSQIGGTLANAAWMFAVTMGLANIAKGVVVYVRTGVRSLPTWRWG